jgi:hypothetical protein
LLPASPLSTPGGTPVTGLGADPESASGGLTGCGGLAAEEEFAGLPCCEGPACDEPLWPFLGVVAGWWAGEAADGLCARPSVALELPDPRDFEGRSAFGLLATYSLEAESLSG